MGFSLPWGRSDIRLTGRFSVQWLKGFEGVAGNGEELSADEMIVSFPHAPSESAMRIMFEINGIKLAARIKTKKIFLSEEPVKNYRCVCRFVMMGPVERKQLDEVLENAPTPPYKRERVFLPRANPATIVVSPEIESKIVALLVREKRIAPPAGTQRPLLAFKQSERVTEDGVGGTQYSVRSRMATKEGGLQTYDTPVFIPDHGPAQIMM